VGDAEFQKKCLGKMQDVASQGRTVLFVSHNMSAIQNLCGRSILLLTGMVQAIGPVKEVIEQYSHSGHGNAANYWKRPFDQKIEIVGLDEITLILKGKQPSIKLGIEISLLMLTNNDKPIFMALDICDQAQTPIMQAVPKPHPFIDIVPGRKLFLLEVDLPPLIPGHYYVDFWLGSHFSTTNEYLKNIVSFEISEGPSEERNYPYSSAHGSIVPTSRCEALN